MIDSTDSVQRFDNRPLVARLALGTAQIGARYGATNRFPPPDAIEVGVMLERAAATGVAWIDTAPAYGEAEALLGPHLERFPNLRVATKISSLTGIPPGEAGPELRRSVSRSLERLRRDRIELLLLHRAADLFRVDAADLQTTLTQLKAAGTIERVGVSLYDPADLDAVLAASELDVVQAPLNPLDRRFAAEDVRQKLRDRGIAFHARSLFLQGLLVAASPDLPNFAKHHAALASWARWLSDHRISPVAACLDTLRTSSWVEVGIVGAATAGQLTEILDGAAAVNEVPDFDLPSVDLDLIDPRRWPAQTVN